MIDCRTLVWSWRMGRSGEVGNDKLIYSEYCFRRACESPRLENQVAHGWRADAHGVLWQQWPIIPRPPQEHRTHPLITRTAGSMKGISPHSSSHTAISWKFQMAVRGETRHEFHACYASQSPSPTLNFRNENNR